MAITDSVILSSGNIEIYQSDIDILCDDYISTLQEPNMIHKPMVFKGLLLYIYNSKVKYIIDADKQTRNNNYYNYKLLDSIFNNIYIPLTYKYNIVPTIQEFCNFVRIDNKYMSDIKSGYYKPDHAKVNPESVRTVKNWFGFCESALVSNTVQTNGIGSIFLLKANYNYSDQQPQQIQITTGSTEATPEQIAERYKNAEKPVLTSVE